MTTDFQTNKRIIAEITIVGSKRLRNKIAGYTTHLMQRIQKGNNVPGISLKLQEAEKERRFDFVPQVSYVDENISKGIYVDADVQDMLDSIGFGKVEGLQKDRPKRNKGKRPHQKKEE
jgi:small subunit ribosomal protein S17e